MRTKLKLQMEDLSVESFDTDAPKQRRGTVFGCAVNTCGDSCYVSCEATCNSCDAYCTQWDATCRNIGTCDGNYWGNCPAVP
jgi:hypothetical protein